MGAQKKVSKKQQVILNLPVSFSKTGFVNLLEISLLIIQTSVTPQSSKFKDESKIFSKIRKSRLAKFRDPHGGRGGENYDILKI